MMKRLLYIFIPVLAVFLMSHNASAANLGYNLNDYDWKNSVNLGTQYCAYTYNTFNDSPSICVLRADRPYMYGLRSYNIAHKKGDLAEFYIGVQDNINGANITYNLGFFIDNFGSINSNYKIINIDKVIGNVYYDQNTNNTILVCDSGSQHFLECTQTQTLPLNDENANLFADVYKISILFTNDGSSPIGVEALNSTTPIATCKINQLPNNLNNGAQCRVRLFGFTQWEYKGSSVNQEQKQETQDAADNSSTAGDTSTSDATSATSSLLSVIGSGIGAITSATPSNCVINGNMGNLDMGSIDLCANPVPTYMATIGSFIAVMLVLPLVIILFNRFIGIIRSFQT